MPRKSNLILSQEQEAELVKWVIERTRGLRTDNNERILEDQQSWQAYENDVQYRAQNKESIFRKSNLHLPLTAMVVENFRAAAEEVIVDEPPFFDFSAVGPSDVTKAQPFSQYYDWKLNKQAKTFATLQDGMLPIFVQRAAIFKAAFDEDVRCWIDRDRPILYDEQTGEPVQILNHGPIIHGEDRFEARPDPLATPPSELPEGEEWAPPMRQHLVADPTFVLDETRHTWRLPPEGLTREEVLYRGPKSYLVPSDRFLCPSDARTIEEADINVELDDKDFAWFRRMWQEGRAWAPWEMVATTLAQGDASPKTEGEQKRDNKENLAHDTKNPKRAVLIAWCRRDVLGWGKPQEFVIFIDERTEKAVFYDFQAKVTSDFKRPYTAIAAGKTKDRWWGKSLPEKVREYQTKADQQMNGELYRNTIRANPFKGGDKSALKNPQQEIVAGPDDFLETKQSRKLDEVIQYVTLPDADTRTQFIVEYVTAWVQRWLGVSDISQGDYSEAPENNTLGGIERTLNQGSKINRPWIRRITRGFEEHVLKLVQIGMTTLPANAVEVFNYFEGDEWKIGQLTGTDIRRVEIDVKLRLRKAPDAKAVERINAGKAIVQEYLSTPPVYRPFLRPFYVDALQRLEFANAEKLLPEIPPELPAVGGGAQPGAATGAPDNGGGTQSPPPEPGGAA